MAKYLIILFNVVGLFIFNYYYYDINVDVKAPEEQDAGTPFTIEVKINKADLESFARFQMELPLGFTATPLNSEKGDFTFKDQKVKILWLTLPSDEEFTISFEVNTDPTVDGVFFLNSTFSYIDENERKTHDVEAHSIRINGSPLADGNSGNNGGVFDPNNLDPNNISCYRQVPYVSPADGSIIVNLLVNKGDKFDFAKIEEAVPDGFIAINRESQEGIFTYTDNTVKFLWMTMPTESQYVVSYKLMPSEGKTIADLDLNGTFSYLEGEGNTKTVPILEKDVNLDTYQAMADNGNNGSDGSNGSNGSNTGDGSNTSDGNNGSNGSNTGNGTNTSDGNNGSNGSNTGDGTNTSDGSSGSNGTADGNESTGTSSWAKLMLIDVKTTLNAPLQANAGEPFNVEVTINKADAQSIARYQMILPPGFTAREVNSSNGAFTFEDQKVSIMWFNLPIQEEFTITFEVNTTQNVDGQFTLNSSFSFIDEENMKTFDVDPHSISIKGEQVVVVPETGVSFSVQICALRKYRDPSYFKKKRYNLKDDIKLEPHEGWNKYTIGSFNIYKDARDYRVNIWNTTPIDDAFVAAYNNGNRITVQEALMIANQEWYK